MLAARSLEPLLFEPLNAESLWPVLALEEPVLARSFPAWE
jgi:hypothetical protein